MTGGGFFSILFVVFLLVAALALFCVPPAVAVRKGHHHATAILVVTILSPFTFGIAWLVALIWALALEDKIPADVRAAKRRGGKPLGRRKWSKPPAEPIAARSPVDPHQEADTALAEQVERELRERGL